MQDRIELRVRGCLLGVIVGGTALHVKRGHHMYEVDWGRTLAEGAPVIFERVLHPEGVDSGPGVADGDSTESPGD